MNFSVTKATPRISSDTISQINKPKRSSEGQKMLTLGRLNFWTSTVSYDKLTLLSTWEWTEQKRIGNTSSLHFTGMAPQKLTIPCRVIDNDVHAGIYVLDHLKFYAESGRVLPLANSHGQSLGKWCISSVTEELSAIAPEGYPRGYTFTLTLLRYDDLKKIRENAERRVKP